MATFTSGRGIRTVISGCGMSIVIVGAGCRTVISGCGWRTVTTAATMAEVEALRPRLRSEPLFAVIGISPAEPPRVLPPRDGAHLTDRFRRALGGVEA